MSVVIMECCSEYKVRTQLAKSALKSLTVRPSFLLACSFFTSSCAAFAGEAVAQNKTAQGRGPNGEGTCVRLYM